jgi:hypothetical protein
MGVQRSRGSVINVRDEVGETLAGNQSHPVVTNILSYEEERDAFDNLKTFIMSGFYNLLHLSFSAIIYNGKSNF